jgi:hypothetical protein
MSRRDYILMGLKDFPAAVDGLSNYSREFTKIWRKGGLQEVQDMAKRLG